MLNNRRFKFCIVAVGIMLWLPPHEVIGEDTEIKNQLSYVSKIVGVIEGSLIKIEGNVRFIKRQAEKRIVESNVSVKRLDNLEEKIKNTENSTGFNYSFIYSNRICCQTINPLFFSLA